MNASNSSECPRNRDRNRPSPRAASMIFKRALRDALVTPKRSPSSAENTLTQTSVKNFRARREENEVKSVETTECSQVIGTSSQHAESVSSLCIQENKMCVNRSKTRTNKDSHDCNSRLNHKQKDCVDNFTSSRNVVSHHNHNNAVSSSGVEQPKNNSHSSSDTFNQVCTLNTASLFHPDIKYIAQSFDKAQGVENNITPLRTNSVIKSECTSTDKEFYSNKAPNLKFDLGECNSLENEGDTYDLPKTPFSSGNSDMLSSSSAVVSAENCREGSENSWESCSSSETNSETHACSSNTKQKCVAANNDGSLNETDYSEIENSSIEPEQITAISEFLLSIEKENTVCNNTAHKVLRDLSRVFRKFFEGDRVDVYGSYQSGLAVSTSNLNLVILSGTSIKSSFMSQVHRVLLKELPGYHNLTYEETVRAKNSKISFFEPYTSVACELVYLGKSRKDIAKLDNLLKELCFLDKRIKTLITAARVWAETCGMHEAEVGKLTSIAFALMIVHFLQHREKPLLPIIDASSNLKELRAFSGVHSSVGELWLDFLKYYTSVFNWSEHTISITSKQPVYKSSRPWKQFWIDIEDPYTKKNVAESVKTLSAALHIQACFKRCYHYFLCPCDISQLNTEKPDNEKNNCRRWHFSFDSCAIYQETSAVCEACEDLGSTCEDCTEKSLEPLKILSKMSKESLEIVSETLNNAYVKYILPDEEIEKRMSFVMYLQKYILQRFYGAKLTLFGSSVNGFGFKHSDLDICMTFKLKTESEINKPQILKVLSHHLRRHGSLKHVLFLPSAKVPIVKFIHKPSGYRCDISLYNTLAVHNSELLWTYSLIDVRCRIIACVLKLLAKKACICDTANKTLSSYSYILMAIHFLQQTDPPILPVLQNPKMFRSSNPKNENPVVYVENCNVWFCKHLEGIKGVYGAKNKKSVGELWLDLLSYYVNFNFDQVITIRQAELLKMQDKQSSVETFTYSNLFNIEDPFITTKNLGCSVSVKGAREIQSVFCKALQLFGTPLPHRPFSIADLEKHFFAPANLTRRFIKDIECPLCGKVGHGKDDCNAVYRPKQRFVSRKPHTYGHFQNKNVILRSS